MGSKKKAKKKNASKKSSNGAALFASQKASKMGIRKMDDFASKQNYKNEDGYEIPSESHGHANPTKSKNHENSYRDFDEDEYVVPQLNSERKSQPRPSPNTFGVYENEDHEPDDYDLVQKDDEPENYDHIDHGAEKKQHMYGKSVAGSEGDGNGSDSDGSIYGEAATSGNRRVPVKPTTYETDSEEEGLYGSASDGENAPPAWGAKSNGSDMYKNDPLPQEEDIGEAIYQNDTLPPEEEVGEAIYQNDTLPPEEEVGEAIYQNDGGQTMYENSDVKPALSPRRSSSFIPEATLKDLDDDEFSRRNVTAHLIPEPALLDLDDDDENKRRVSSANMIPEVGLSDFESAKSSDLIPEVGLDEEEEVFHGFAIEPPETSYNETKLIFANPQEWSKDVQGAFITESFPDISSKKEAFVQKQEKPVPELPMVKKKGGKWQPKSKSSTTKTKDKFPAWMNAKVPTGPLNTRTDRRTPISSQAKSSKYGAAETNPRLQQVGGLDTKTLDSFLPTSIVQDIDQDIQKPKFVSKEWKPEQKVGALVEAPTLNVGKLNISDIAENVSKPKEYIKPAELTNIKSDIPGITALDKDKTSADMAEEEFGFGFDFDIDSIKPWNTTVGIEAPAVDLSERDERSSAGRRAIRRRREE